MKVPHWSVTANTILMIKRLWHCQWDGYNGGARCHRVITINGNGRSVTTRVVDECDSKADCNEDHAYQPPYHNNIADASKAVWEALGVSQLG
ncbi:rlpA-like double-psi beta-barrel domain-containing protein [Artemisia annua]|uniref:RlpA-like double-psi beta-barrel domain-containing protein n=1 Tax=Artemisia annua TaxID=35608 RepID=A0A2U1KPE2_ARTAN|nr:rlpA-like double-psi beta-barrel domain-containing protein [Artemisia annua]